MKVTNLARTLDEMKERGFGSSERMHPPGKITALWTARCLWRSLSEAKAEEWAILVKEKCDFLIKLPMAGKVTSLNASVAVSLLMYEVYRKRNPLGE